MPEVNANERRCSNCGARLAATASDLLCFTCALRGALAVETAGAPGGSGPRPESVFPRPFGEYELLGEIGRGGMGVVFRARQTRLNRLVAIKMIRDQRLANPAARQRFLGEARAAASLRHPNLVTVHEVGEHEGQPYFSMEYVEGPNLAALAGAGDLTPRRAAEIVRETARAIGAAHRAGILHRDLKPANVLIDPTGHPRVADFGLAKHVNDQQDLTVTGEMLGSPGFMAPEQLAGPGAAVGAPADIYGLGAILYSLLAGRPPFTALALAELLDLIRHSEPAPPDRIRPSVPRSLGHICLMCLHKDPAARYPTADALADDLDRFLRGRRVAARPPGILDRLRRWSRRDKAATGLTLTLLILVAGAAWWRWDHRTKSQELQHAEVGRLLREARENENDPAPGHRARTAADIAAALRLNPPPAMLGALRDEFIRSLTQADIAFPPAPAALPTNGSFAVNAALSRFAVRTPDRIEVRDATTGVLQAAVRLPAGDDGKPLAVSPGGRYLAVAGADGSEIAVWSTNTNASGPVFRHTGLWAGFTADDRMAFLIVRDPPDLLGIELPSGIVHQAGMQMLNIRSAAISPDGRHLAAVIAPSAAGSPWWIQHFDLANGWWSPVTSPLPGNPEGPVFTPDGRAVVLRPPDGGIRFLETTGLRRLFVLPGDRGGPTVSTANHGPHLSLLRSPAGSWQTINLLPAPTYQEFKPGANTAQVRAGFDLHDVGFDPSGRLVRVLGAREVWFWDAASGRAAGNLDVNGAHGAAFGPVMGELWSAGSTGLGRRLVLADDPGDPTARHLGPHTVVAPEFKAENLVMSPDGRFAVGPHRDAGTFAIQPLDRTIAPLVVEPFGRPTPLALAVGSNRVAAAGAAMELLGVWELATGRPVRELAGVRGGQIGLTPDDRWLAAGTATGYAVWNTSTWEPVWSRTNETSGGTALRLATFSRRGEWLAVLTRPNQVALLRPDTGELVARLPAPALREITRLAFDPAGRRLAALLASGAVGVWDLARLRESVRAAGLPWAGPEYPPATVGPNGEPAGPDYMITAATPRPTFPPTYPTNVAGVDLSGEFNLSRDFSATRNPNGPWTYGWKDSLNGEFKKFLFADRTPREKADQGNHLAAWEVSPKAIPCLHFNASQSTLKLGNGIITCPPRSVWFNPLRSSTIDSYSGVLFTAPADGEYRLRLDASPLVVGVTDANNGFAVLHENRVLIKKLLASGDGLGFTNSIRLQRGETLQLLVGQGADPVAQRGALKLAVQIDRLHEER